MLTLDLTLWDKLHIEEAIQELNKMEHFKNGEILFKELLMDDLICR